jgi:arylsulfatase A-like enzyme
MAMQCGAMILAAFLAQGYAFSAEPARHEFSSPHMGTVVRIVSYSEKAAAEAAAKAAFARIAQLEEIFSDYKPTSEVMRLCKVNDVSPNLAHPASRELIEVIERAKSLSERSRGTFDITVGPITQLWRQTRRTQQMPDADELKSALALVDSRNVVVDRDRQTVTLKMPGIRLDFGGIAKGYAADEAMKILRERGLPRSLVAVSGDVLCGDAPPGKAGWEVEVAPIATGMAPRMLTLSNMAVSTSGDLFQYVEINGVRYSHVLDPKSGLGLTGRRSATVVAPKAIDADSLTKAASVLPPDEALKLIDEVPHAATLIAVKETETSDVTISRSSRMAKYLPEPKKPNVIFIMADDLGINDLSCYGRKDQSTPYLDKLASQGIRFTSAYCAQSICSPSRAAIMTGKHPARLHITTFLPGRADAASQKLLHPKIRQQLPLEEKTMAEYFKDAGYATACIGKWHLGGANFGPAKQGFDVVYAGQANTTPSDSEGGKGEFDLTRKAIDFVRTNKDKPFFLYVPHNIPHINFKSKTALVEKFRESWHPEYAAMIHSMDESVGVLLKAIDELKLTDNTLVVFTSDNGGVHMLEGQHDSPTHNTPYRAGKGFLYEGGLRIPAIVRWPGVVPMGTVTPRPFVNTDWLPTFLDALGKVPDGPLDGRSVFPLLHDRAIAATPLIWHFPHYNNQGGRPGGAVRDGDWKYLEYYDTGESQLFDLAADVGETNNLADREPKRVAAMGTLLKDAKKRLAAQEMTPNPKFDEALFRKLYVDVDPTRVTVRKTSKETSDPWREWRATMNKVVAKP